MSLVAAAAAALALAAPAAASPPVVRTDVEPATVLFGEPATATVTVVVDRRLVDPGSVRIEADVLPFRPVGVAETEREEAGRLVVLTQRTRLACVTDACRPDVELRAVALPAVRVTARGRDGRPSVVRRERPPLLVAPRVPAAAATGEPEWRFDPAPPKPSYRLGPSLLAALLWTAAAGLAAGAIVLLARELVRLRRRRGAARLSELEAALAAVRAALDADARERRRAVGRLARVLGRRRDGRTATATALAWDVPDPDRGRVAALADEVEREVPA